MNQSNKNKKISCRNWKLSAAAAVGFAILSVTALAEDEKFVNDLRTKYADRIKVDYKRHRDRIDSFYIACRDKPDTHIPLLSVVLSTIAKERASDHSVNVLITAQGLTTLVVKNQLDPFGGRTNSHQIFKLSSEGRLFTSRQIADEIQQACSGQGPLGPIARQLKKAEEPTPVTAPATAPEAATAASSPKSQSTVSAVAPLASAAVPASAAASTAVVENVAPDGAPNGEGPVKAEKRQP